MKIDFSDGEDREWSRLMARHQMTRLFQRAVVIGFIAYLIIGLTYIVGVVL